MNAKTIAIPTPMSTINLVLQRTHASEISTQGTLTVGGLSICTLEPPRRDPPDKPRAIDAGTYQVTLRMSPRLGYVTPFLHEVPDFEDVLLHIGNYPTDTRGCVLVGLTANTDSINSSKQAFGALMAVLDDSSNISLAIFDPI